MSEEFKAKLRSLTFSTKGFETREHKNYYDREAVHATFGDDAAEQARENTNGLGYGRTVGGEHYHRDRKTKEWVKTTPEEFDRGYLGNKYVADPKGELD